MNTAEKFNSKQVIVEAIGFLLIATTINPILDTIATYGATQMVNQAASVYQRTIPGIAYNMAEIQCRTWHRNRANRPFNFLLKP